MPRGAARGRGRAPRGHVAASGGGHASEEEDMAQFFEAWKTEETAHGRQGDDPKAKRHGAVPAGVMGLRAQERQHGPEGGGHGCGRRSDP